MSLLRLCLLLLLPLLTPACEKEPLDTLDELVPATQEGANTLGCLIDGEVFYNQGGSLNVRDISSSLSTIPTERIGIVGKDVSHPNAENWSRIYLTIPIPFSGSHQFQDYTLGYNRGLGAERVDSYVDTTELNIIDAEYYNPQSRVISGTFEFTVIEEDTGVIRRITDGRFDVVYQ